MPNKYKKFYNGPNKAKKLGLTDEHDIIDNSETDQMTELDYVTQDDVDARPNKYQQGSIGQIKSVAIIGDKDTEYMGDTITVHKKVMVFYYENPMEPTQVTGINKVKIQDEQVVST